MELDGFLGLKDGYIELGLAYVAIVLIAHLIERQ